MRLFPADSTVWEGLGLGLLAEATKSEVLQQRNGQYELEFDYPMTGVRYNDLDTWMIVMAKPDPYTDEQPFRIYKISRPINGIVTVYAHHLSYDLTGIPVSPFKATNLTTALVYLRQYAEVTCPFTFWTDKSSDLGFNVNVPSSIRSLLSGSEGGITDRYGGEWEFDGWNCKLWAARGANNGVVIRYGKNLTALEEHKIVESWATGIYPYWTDGSEGSESQRSGLVTLPEKIVWASEERLFDKVFVVDMSDRFEADEVPPTAAMLRSKANSYISGNKLDDPYVSVLVDFVALDQTEEYKDVAVLESVHLCDIVTIEYPKLNVRVTAKVVSTKYDVLAGRYKSVEVGSVRTTIADIIAGAHNDAEDAADAAKTAMQAAIDSATQLITGNLGNGYVVLHVNNDGVPYEILIMDKPDINDATAHVWRWNSEGLGYSSTGYNGPYGTAITSDGAIVADFITTGVLNADLIRAGHLDAQFIQVNGYDLDNYFKVENDGGTVQVVIGSDGMYRLVQKANRLSFYVGNTEKAYWTTDSFVLSTLNTFQLGSIKMVAQANGSVSVIGV